MVIQTIHGIRMTTIEQTPAVPSITPPGLVRACQRYAPRACRWSTLGSRDTSSSHCGAFFGCRCFFCFVCCFFCVCVVCLFFCYGWASVPRPPTSSFFVVPSVPLQKLDDRHGVTALNKIFFEEIDITGKGITLGIDM